ncbi:hypothetical protein Droror1_Dr00002504 [Drosera rotundifolia]
MSETGRSSLQVLLLRRTLIPKSARGGSKSGKIGNHGGFQKPIGDIWRHGSTPINRFRSRGEEDWAKIPVAKPVSSDARVIAHADMDCFYVQVEQRRQPQMRGLPTAVVQYNS